MAGAAEKCEIQLSYAIGVREPVSVRVEGLEHQNFGVSHRKRIRGSFVQDTLG